MVPPPPATCPESSEARPPRASRSRRNEAVSQLALAGAGEEGAGRYLQPLVAASRAVLADVQADESPAREFHADHNGICVF